MNIQSFMINKLHTIVLLLLLVLMNYYIFFFFPATEGWWQTYAYLVSKGLTPYIDFNMNFPPLFIYFNALLMKINNYFVFYRLIGVIELLIMFILLANILKKFYSNDIALNASFISIYLMMNMYLFIPNDYHVFVNLLTISSLFAYINYKYKNNYLSKLLYLALTTFFIVTVLLVKQNIGIMLTCSIILILIIEDYRNRSFYSFFYLFFYVMSFYLFSILMDFKIQQFFDLIFHNDSKGSITSLAFNFLFNDLNREYFFVSLGLATIFIYFSKYSTNLYRNKLFISIVIIAIALLIFRHHSPLNKYLIIITLSYMWVELWELRKSFDKYDLVLIFFSLVYANTLTADITMMYIYIISTFIIALTLTYCKNHLDTKTYTFISYIVLIMVSIAFIRDKFKYPYEWWSASQAKISEAKYSLPYEQLKYIHVDQSTANMFNTIYNVIQYNSHGNDLYLYPHIPIFYVLHNKVPLTNNPITWFDVTTTQNITEELDNLKKVHPNLVIMLTPKGAAYSVHERLKKMPQKQIEIPKYFNSMIVNGKYQLIKYQIYNNDLFKNSISSKQLITLEYQVLNPNLFNKHILDLNISSENTTILKIKSQNKDLYYLDMFAHSLRPYDQITITAPANQVDFIAQKIGPPDDLKETLYALKIYKKIR